MGRLLHGMQPRIISKLLARFQVVMQPADDWFFDQVAVFEQITVNLLAHLNGVTAIDKNGGLIAQHNSCARRSGKAGQPRQTFGPCWYVFALMFIGARHNKAVNALGRQIGAQGIQSMGGVKIILGHFKKRFALIPQGQQFGPQGIIRGLANQINPVFSRAALGCGQNTVNQVDDSANILVDIGGFKQFGKLSITGNGHEDPL